MVDLPNAENGPPRHTRLDATPLWPYPGTSVSLNGTTSTTVTWAQCRELCLRTSGCMYAYSPRDVGTSVRHFDGTSQGWSADTDVARSTRADGTVGGGAGFTVSAFVDPAPEMWDTWARVIGFGNGRHSENIAVTFRMGLGLAVKRPSIAIRWLQPASSLPRGAGEHHVAATITCEGGCEGASTGTAKLFLDGVLVASESDSFPFPARVHRSGMYVGKSHWSDDPYNDPYYKGTMRDLHVWDVALSDDQVADLYTAGGLFPPSVRALPAPIVSHYVIRGTFTGGPASNDDAVTEGDRRDYSGTCWMYSSYQPNVNYAPGEKWRTHWLSEDWAAAGGYDHGYSSCYDSVFNYKTHTFGSAWERTTAIGIDDYDGDSLYDVATASEDGLVRLYRGTNETQRRGDFGAVVPETLTTTSSEGRRLHELIRPKEETAAGAAEAAADGEEAPPPHHHRHHPHHHRHASTARSESLLALERAINATTGRGARVPRSLRTPAGWQARPAQSRSTGRATSLGRRTGGAPTRTLLVRLGRTGPSAAGLASRSPSSSTRIRECGTRGSESSTSRTDKTGVDSSTWHSKMVCH